MVEGFAAPGANVITGTVIDESAGEELRIVMVATGLGLADGESGEIPLIPVGESASNVAVLPIPGPGAGGEPAGKDAQASAGGETGAAAETGHRGYFQPGDYIRRRVREGWRG